MSEQNKQFQPLEVEPRDDPILAEGMAYEGKPDLDRAHDLGKMVTEVEVTPANTSDEREYARKKLDTLESMKDYSPQLMQAKKAAEDAASVKETQFKASYNEARRAQLVKEGEPVVAGTAGSAK